MGKLNVIVESGKQEMSYTRSFDAPLSLVWKVFTTPEHVARWWGPRSISPVATGSSWPPDRRSS